MGFHDAKGVRAAAFFAGNFLRMLSLAYVLLLYAAPYVLLRDASLGSLFEATLSLAVAAGAIAVLRRVNDWHGNVLLGFFLSRGGSDSAQLLRRGTHAGRACRAVSRQPVGASAAVVRRCTAGRLMRGKFRVRLENCDSM